MLETLTNPELKTAARFEPFWVGILKGDAYPDNDGRGLVHRSPPIGGSGQTRVLFCLDF